jgi:DNA (cytosine-5)-methyltransferase 1
MTTRAMPSDSPSAIDLFCGAGGLSGALERAGFRTVTAVDADRDCVASLEATQQASVRIAGSSRRYLAGTRLLRADIREVSSGDLVPADAPLGWRPDVLAGGPPCQPFSSAGTGLGLNDPRGQLFTHFVRLADELKPRMVLFENVAGLVTAKGRDGRPGGVLRLIQARFEEVGYACRFALLNAADYGAAQRRVRLYMVASRDEGLPNFPIATHSAAQEHGLKPWVGLGKRLAGLPPPMAEDLIRPKGKRAAELEVLEPGNGLKSHGIVEANRPSGHWGYRQDCFVADSTRPSRTIRAASTPDWLRTPDGLRRLTWQECAALQGFDPDWVFEGGRTSRYRQIGNAVQGDIGKAIADSLIVALKHPVRQTPLSEAWPAAFDKRVRYTAMEQRTNGEHRRAARAGRGQTIEMLSAAE